MQSDHARGIVVEDTPASTTKSIRHNAVVGHAGHGRGNAGGSRVVAGTTRFAAHHLHEDSLIVTPHISLALAGADGRHREARALIAIRPVAMNTLCIALAMMPGVLAAQATVTGVVRDTAGRPLANTALALDPDREVRGTRTDAQGQFRFDRVTPGEHVLRTTRIGYRPDDRRIDVPSGGVSIEIVLVPVPFRLDTLAVVARRTGVVGTVMAQTTFRPLNRSIVQVLGTRWRAQTRDDGRFEFPGMPPGAYTVNVRRDGYRTRMISAIVPESGAVELAAVLDSLTTRADRFMEDRLRQMASRVTWRRRNELAVVPRHELLLAPNALLDEALRYAPSVIAKGIIIGRPNVCALFVNGEREPVLRLEDFRAEDVAMVEVYRRNGCATPVFARGGQVVVLRREGPPGVNVYIWLKR